MGEARPWKSFVLVADGIASVYILDVDGERQVLLAQHGSSTSAEDLADLQAVLDSIRIYRSPTPVVDSVEFRAP